MCGGLESGNGRSEAGILGLAVVEDQSGGAMIIDPKHTSESLRSLLERISMGLGPKENKTTWVTPKQDVKIST